MGTTTGRTGGNLYATGTCGPLPTANQIAINDGITIERFANVDVETETIVKRCTLYLKQLARSKTDGLVPSVIQGSTLEIAADARSRAWSS